ncbi:hypothetical protein NQ317_018165 [Molorchus minor]|uniref:Uncharacterized protein n=1 Tax=Molorchus minor TaxID=1323400 RepID=A0ABQ9J9S0_9CUCU|nr:hypothetical protein NQ317_018165 [Molorchus minor]
MTDMNLENLRGENEIKPFPSESDTITERALCKSDTGHPIDFIPDRREIPQVGFLFTKENANSRLRKAFDVMCVLLLLPMYHPQIESFFNRRSIKEEEHGEEHGDSSLA